ncbi:hypothetical protein P4S54_04825 [Shewanella sp. PP-He15 brown]
MNQRRRFLMAGGAIAAGFGLSQTVLAIGLPSLDTLENDSKISGGSGMNKIFWPSGEQLVISISMQFEAGAQDKNAEGPFPP